MYINIVHFFSKPWGGGAENNPVRSSVSAKYDKSASTRAYVTSNFSGSKITHSKSVVRCSV